MIKITKFLMIVFVTLISAVTANAQCTIQGTVKNGKGDNLNKAIIAIPALGLTTSVDNDGGYKFSNIPEGRYSVEANNNGYEQDVEEVSVTPINSATINFVLGKNNKNIKEIIVTGVANPKSSLESSISISTLKSKDIINAVPRTTAEIFRTIAGIRSESSGGEGNSNITVRGVPVSAGGSRYMLLQEDGLPVLQFGDVSFGTQDQFLRFDNTVNRVEALRGGSASVLASNSPAGIINFISKTGETEGGSVATTIGLNYQNYRTDFDYGAPIGNNLFFHVGGFYREGDGPRKTGYTSNNGGQIKANITKKFNNGFVRIYVKSLNDRTAAYMPMPVQVTGTNDKPIWQSLAGYDAFNGSLQSKYLMSDRTMDGNNNILQSNVADGMHSISNTFGTEFNFTVGNGWNIVDKARASFNNGQFIAPFPATAGGYSTIFSDAGSGVPGFGSATYAGTNTAVNMNDQFMRIHLFNTTLNNFNNYINDIGVGKTISKEFKFHAGVYKSIQNISMDWHWNTYLMEANTANGNRLIDVKDTAGKALTTNGLLAYGTPAWGNCCNRMYNTTYDVTAPYANIELQPIENLNLDLGIRYDMGHVTGNFSGGNGQTAAIDMNGNGVIDANEKAVATIGTNATPVNYKYNLVSYSAGANYELDKHSSLFARSSFGGSASADRVLFSGYNYVGNNDSGLNAQKVNTVGQQEIGYKVRQRNYVLNATLFLAITKENNYEATKQKFTSNNYQSFGLEFDGAYNISKEFSVRGSFTYTYARITNALDTSIIGNTPRRLPAVMFNATPTYMFGNGNSAGITFLGFTKSFTQDENKLIMPKYLVVNPYINIMLMKNLLFNLSGNNVFNALGITEAEEGHITNGTTNIVRGRPIPGRSISAAIRFNF